MNSIFLYNLFLSLHIISVIAWMAGLLYLPRIFVYHSESKSDEVKNTFKIMERRLFVYIMNPAMILSWLFGLILIHSIGLQSFGEFWLIVKMLLVLSLTFYHFFLFNCLNSSSVSNSGTFTSNAPLLIESEAPIRFIIGFVVMLIMGFISIDFWRACSPFLYLFGIILLLCVLFIGDYGGGAKR